MSEDLISLRQFDPCIEEVLFSGDCTAWNDKRPSQTLDGVLFIVKRTIEPSFQMILKPVDTDSSNLCSFLREESVKRFEEVEKPIFMLPTESGFIIFFNNVEDSTLARDCIKRLSHTSSHEPCETAVAEEVGKDNDAGDTGLGDTDYQISILTGDVGNSTENYLWDQNVYFQNTRVIMAMIAVLLATVVLTVGLNPPASISTLPVKIIFQITFWIGAVFSLAALLILGVVTPTSFEMQAHIFRCAYISIQVSMVCVVLSFAATTLSVSSNLFSCIVGVIVGLLGLLVFFYFSSKTLRDTIYSFTGFRLTQNGDNISYSVSTF